LDLPLAGGITALAYWLLGSRAATARGFPLKEETHLATG
jgi:hypothetical protein